MFDSKDMRNYNKNVDFNVLSFFPQNNDFNACKIPYMFMSLSNVLYIHVNLYQVYVHCTCLYKSLCT